MIKEILHILESEDEEAGLHTLKVTISDDLSLQLNYREANVY